MLATSALSPGEKIWFKNRTLLDYLPLAIFPRYSAKTNEFQLAKVLLESTHSGYNLDGDCVLSAPQWISCGHGGYFLI